MQEAELKRHSTGRTVVLVGAAVIGVLVFLVVVFVVALSHVNIHESVTPPEPSSYGMNVVLSPDGATAYVTEPAANTLAVLDTRTGAEKAVVPVGPGPAGLALSPDGSQVWVANADAPGFGARSSITVVSTATDAVVGTIAPVISDGVIDVAFAPGGGIAYVTENGGLSNGGVAVVDTATLQVVGQLFPYPDTTWNPTSVAVSPDSQQVWVSAEPAPLAFTHGWIFVFSTATRTELAQIPVGAAPDFMALSPDGRYAYVAAKVGCQVEEIDTATFQTVTSMAAPRGFGCPFGIAAGASSGSVYAVTGNDHTFDQGRQGDALEIYDLTTGMVTGHRIPGADPVTVALSPNDSTAYVVDADHPTIDVVSTATGGVVQKLRLPEPPPTAATTSSGR